MKFPSSEDEPDEPVSGPQGGPQPYKYDAIPTDDEIFPKWKPRLLFTGIVASMALLLFAAYSVVAGRTDKSVLPPPVRIASATQWTADSGLSINPAFSRDGKLVAYASDRDGAGSLRIWLRPYPSGEARLLATESFNDSTPDFSPDGGRVVYRSERDGGGIYIASVSGGPPRLLARAGMRPRFSPDGKWIAYYDAPLGVGSRIFIISPEGGEPKQLQPDFSWARFPVWSPDGRFLLFEGLSAVGWRDWWVTPLEGAAKTAHALETLPGFAGVHAPEHWFDGKILYSAAEQGVSHLWEIAISSTDQQISGTPRQLTNGDGIEQAAGIGPGGEVLFTRMSFTQDLWSLPVDANRGTATGPLQKLTANGANQVPWVTSDGGKLVYVSSRTGLRDIWLRDSGTGQEEALTNFIQVGDRPALSFDGSRIAYPSKSADGRCSVLVRDLEWGSRSSILKGCFNIWSWTPDGSSLAIYTPAANVHAVDLFKVGADERRPLLSHRILSFFDGAFAPGGGWIAFTAGASAVDSQVYVAPFRGTAIRESEWIAIAPTGAGFAAWSPDGATLYYHSRRDGFPCIWSQKLDAARRPAGAPVAVQHFHSISFGTYLMRWNDFHMSVARDRLVLNLVKENANLWTAARRW